MLELIPERETIVDRLAAETEDLYARAEAQQQLSSEQLLVRLVRSGPEAVYLAVLQSLLPDGEGTAVSQQHLDFITMLTREQNWYQKTGRWPLIPRDISTLLHAVTEG